MSLPSVRKEFTEHVADILQSGYSSLLAVLSAELLETIKNTATLREHSKAAHQVRESLM